MIAPTAAEPDTRLWLALDTSTAPPTTAGPRVDARPGRIVAGRYQLRRVLGQGGMGSVWLATDELLLRDVAMKEHAPAEDLMDSTPTNGWVLSEARAAAQIRHPGVVGIYDLALDGEQRWIVMEALSGQTLADTITERGRLDPRHVLDIAVRLLEALRAVHHAGIVHRDVKPSNVQLTSDHRVVLTDFGLASRDGKAPPIKPGQFVGSPPYMAPESIYDGRFGPASDLFSLGATLYTAVEGRKPFEDVTTFSILEAVKNAAPPPARRAGYLRPVIDGLLTKDPDARLTLPQAYDYLKGLQ
jgi:serine/threonine protein kinase